MKRVLRGGSFRAGLDDILPTARGIYDASGPLPGEWLQGGARPGLSRVYCGAGAARSARTWMVMRRDITGGSCGT